MTALVRRLCSLVCVLAGSPVLLLAGESGRAPAVPLYAAVPFVLLLLAIAIVPFLHRHWWEKYYPLVAVGLGIPPVLYYSVVLSNAERVLHAASEYVSFIALIGSLFVVAGGIHIRIRGRSTAEANLFLLAIGAVVSNLLGTTGASMILIRPYIRVNRYRLRPYHIVFFIFVVSNMGGALTPIGDPPLFLGYLRGVPFFWVAEALWGKWLLAMALILAIFYVIDRYQFHRLSRRLQRSAEVEPERGEVTGLSNILFLAVILAAVFVTHPIFVREILMLAAAAGSYLTTRKEIHRKNDFNFLPIKEVALLFLGIFATMVPALDWLELNAGTLGVRSVASFYWATGVLSSFLDNAPTYLNFLSAQTGLLVPPYAVAHLQGLIATYGADPSPVSGSLPPDIRNALAALFRFHYDQVAAGSVPPYEIATLYLLANYPLHLQAISLAAVFFGACTYIGNGPNFMVKSIAQQAGVEMPSFFGYVVRFSVPVLLPIFWATQVLFFRL